MRTLWTGVSALALIISPMAVRADDSAAVKELLDKAVKALGGPEKAAALGSVALKGKCRVTEAGNALDVVAEISIKNLDQIRIEMKANFGGAEQTSTMVMAGDKGWQSFASGKNVIEMPNDELVAMRSMLLAFLAPGNPAALRKRQDLSLANGGEAKVNDTAADVLRISRKDHPDVTIYFDQKSGLPLKTETQIKLPNGQVNQISVHFSDFKEEGGVKYYSKVKLKRDDKEMAEMEITEFKSDAKLDEKAFEKP
jgi:outer membrane lipoprotein-sorting protein